MKQEQPKELQAFTHNLVRFKDTNCYKLKEFDQHQPKKRFVIRSLLGGIHKYNDSNQFWKEYQTYVTKGVEISKEFIKLANHDINLPPYYFVTGLDDQFGELNLYIVVGYQDGNNLDTFKHLKQTNLGSKEKTYQNLYTTLVEGLIGYYHQGFSSGTKVLEDIAHLRQYKIHQSQEDDSCKIILIDTDYFVIQPTSRFQDDICKMLLHMCHTLESKFHTIDQPLQSVKNLIKTFSNTKYEYSKVIT